MSSTKVKVYKNPERNNVETYVPYVPQYQVMGIEPSDHKSPVLSGHDIPSPSRGFTDNPRAPRPYIRQQPYAEAVSSPIGVGRGLIPNVGNNMEQTWSSVDNEIVDDMFDGLDPNQIIDNNDIVSNKALGITDNQEIKVSSFNESIKNYNNISSPYKNNLDNSVSQLKQDECYEEDYQKDNLSHAISQLEEEEYCILVSGAVIAIGSLDDIQEQTRSLIFGDHKLYNGNAVSIDDILVLKRIKIKVGIFLD